MPLKGEMVPGDGIEPPTRGFSEPSTNVRVLKIKKKM
jgi:hypothetical protein